MMMNGAHRYEEQVFLYVA